MDELDAHRAKRLRQQHANVVTFCAQDGSQITVPVAPDGSMSPEDEDRVKAWAQEHGGDY